MSVVEAPVVLLGRSQRIGRVLDVAAAARDGIELQRRASSGTACHFGHRGIVWTLALPSIAALHEDATQRTLLNRNLRGFLAGFARAGLAARYFGREWISLRGAPGALVGYEVDEHGAVLIEVMASMQDGFAIPDSMACPAERSLDRYAGKAPRGLVDLGAPNDALALGERVVEGAAERWGTALVSGAIEEPEALSPIVDPNDPMPAGFEPLAEIRVPIGWIDRAIDPRTGRVWLGGDVLAASGIFDAVSEYRLDGLDRFALDGARADDLLSALQAAG